MPVVPSSTAASIKDEAAGPRRRRNRTVSSNTQTQRRSRERAGAGAPGGALRTQRAAGCPAPHSERHTTRPCEERPKRRAGTT